VDGALAYTSVFDYEENAIVSAAFNHYIVDPLIIEGVGRSDRDRVNIIGQLQDDGAGGLRNPRINASFIIRNSFLDIQALDIVPSVAVCVTGLATWTEAQMVINGPANPNAPPNVVPGGTPNGTLELYTGDTYTRPTRFYCPAPARDFAGVVIADTGALNVSMVEMYDSNIDMSKTADLRKASPVVTPPNQILSAQRAPATAQNWDTTGGATAVAAPLYGLYVDRALDVYLDATNVNNHGRYGVVTSGLANVTTSTSSPNRFVGVYDGAFSGAGYSIVLNHAQATAGNIATVSTAGISITFPAQITRAYTLAQVQNLTPAAISVSAIDLASVSKSAIDGTGVAELQAKINNAAISIFRQWFMADLKTKVETAVQARLDVAIDAGLVVLPNFDAAAKNRVIEALYLSAPPDAKLSQTLNGKIRVQSPYTYSFNYESYTLEDGLGFAGAPEVILTVPNANFYTEFGPLQADRTIELVLGAAELALSDDELKDSIGAFDDDLVIPAGTVPVTRTGVLGGSEYDAAGLIDWLNKMP
jgi:hypothetical protein